MAGPHAGGQATVDVLVVTWNTCELTVSALRRLVDSDQGLRFRVLVHDNASCDGTAEAVRRAVPEAEVFAGSTNLGFAGAVNQLARRSRSPYLLILNGDACPAPGCLERLVRVAGSRRSVAAVAPRLVRPDGTLEHSTYPLPSVPLEMVFATGLRSRLPHRIADRLCLDGDWAHDRPRRVPWAFGAALLVPRDAWRVVGELDERFFMYSEDVEWCWRARRRGLDIWFEPTAQVEHVGNASGARAYGNARSALVERNRLQLYRLYRGRLAAAAYRRLRAANVARLAGADEPAR